MKRVLTQAIFTTALLGLAFPLRAQDRVNPTDWSTIRVNDTQHVCGSEQPVGLAIAPHLDCLRSLGENFGLVALPHPFHWVARHPKAGCSNTADCGTIFAEGTAENLRPSAGATWQANIMSDTSTPPVNNQCNYLALTNTAITPAYADTTLSGEITTNGLARAQATYTNNSTTLTVPSAPTVTVIGTAGSTTYYYWVASCRQSICTTPSATSGSTTTANATLSTTNYNTIVFTGIQGADSYQVYRTTSNSAPSGTVTDMVGSSTAYTPVACTNAATSNCTAYDTSNTLQSVTIPGSNLTYYGVYTLVHTWTATASQSAQAFGVFTANTSGTMCFEGTFTQVSLNSGDTFQLTETIVF